MTDKDPRRFDADAELQRKSDTDVRPRPPLERTTVPETELRSLHLHTLDSLIADLVSGRPVQTGEGEKFVLTDERARSALEWYRKKGATNWNASITVQHGEDLVDTILQKPPEIPALSARPVNANRRRLRLKKLEAHRFAGLHKFGTPDDAPENYVHEFTSPLTLFRSTGFARSCARTLLNGVPEFISARSLIQRMN